MLYLVIQHGLYYETDEDIADNQQACFESKKKFTEEMSLKKGNKWGSSYVHGHNLIAEHASASSNIEFSNLHIIK